LEAAADAQQKKRLKTPLAAAVAHPLRTLCLAVLIERVASPAEIARSLGADVSNVGYHVGALAQVGLVEEVGTRPVRGALEHFYKSVQPPAIEDSEQAAELPPEESRSLIETIVSLYAANTVQALEAGTLLGRPEWHLTRIALNVDEEGWREVAAAYLELYERVYAIGAQAVDRMAASGEAPIRILTYQSLFELPKEDVGE
jgi:DNA-binding transcriptional ArsR family regulator